MPTSVSAAQLRLENKGPIQALHWREAADEEAAREAAERDRRARPRRAGLVPHWGRKVLEIRPVAEIDKGTAVRRACWASARSSSPCSAATTGPTSTRSRALREMANAGRLRAAVCVGVASDEAPPELAERADVVVDGPDGLSRGAEGAGGGASGD